MRGRSAVGDGWQGTGCWSSPPNPLSLVSPPSPELSVLFAEGATVVLTVTDRACKGAAGVSVEGEADTSTRVCAGLRRITVPLVTPPVAAFMGTGTWRPEMG
uniref:Uncharacterized protein n=1 Tax=Knipowitschia caucasica TaxID=637954 RepID=A0AAV2MAN1_KNICA